jgi:hypothetical protein
MSLSAYEQRRLANIQKNNAAMVDMGLTPSNARVTRTTRQRAKRKTAMQPKENKRPMKRRSTYARVSVCVVVIFNSIFDFIFSPVLFRIYYRLPFHDSAHAQV